MQAPSVYMKIFKFITLVRRGRHEEEVFSCGKDDSSVRIAEVLYLFFSIKVDESIILIRRRQNMCMGDVCGVLLKVDYR